MTTPNHRRISLSDIIEPERRPTQPDAQLPPEYVVTKAGGREEFFNDLEAYQAAAKIHATHHQSTLPVTTTPETEAPSYDSIGEAMPTIHETKIFKRRLLETLRSIRDFMEKRRQTPSWSNLFGVSEKIQIIVCGILMLGMVVGLIGMCVWYRQVAGILALCLFLLVFSVLSYFVTRKMLIKSRLVQALQKGLIQVEKFEKMDDVTLDTIRNGVAAVLSPMYWIQKERDLEEAIPEFARGPPPPPHLRPHAHRQNEYELAAVARPEQAHMQPSLHVDSDVPQTGGAAGAPTPIEAPTPTYEEAQAHVLAARGTTSTAPVVTQGTAEQAVAPITEEPQDATTTTTTPVVQAPNANASEEAREVRN